RLGGWWPVSANVPPAAIAIAAAVPASTGPSRLSMDQRPRIFQILLTDGRRRPERERRDSVGRVVAGILWKRAGAEHEEVRYIPALQISIERAGLGIGAHDGAAVEMRRLVRGHVVGSFARFLIDDARAHCPYDLGIFVGHELGGLELVLVEVDGHAHERPTETIGVGRIEIEIDVTIAIEAAVNAPGFDTAQVIVGGS